MSRFDRRSHSRWIRTFVYPTSSQFTQIRCRFEVSQLSQFNFRISGVENTPTIRRDILSVLERGFSDRVSLIRIIPTESPVWSVEKSRAPSIENNIVIGVLLNLVRARSVIDLGPSGDDTEAVEQFKDFWGSKAELRRFRDGRIVMAAGNLGNYL